MRTGAFQGAADKSRMGGQGVALHVGQRHRYAVAAQVAGGGQRAEVVPMVSKNALGGGKRRWVAG